MPQKTKIDFKNIFDNVQDFVFLVNRTGEILYSNKSFSDFFGLEKNKIGYEIVSDLFEKEKADLLLNEIVRSITKTKPSQINLEKNFQMFTFSINPVKSENAICNSALIIAFDNSENFEWQQELINRIEELEVARDAFQDNAGELAKAYDELEFSRRELEETNKKMEEQNKLVLESEEQQKVLNAQKDKFVSIISHDLRAPFTSILGYSDALMTAWDAIADPEKLEFIEIINKAAKAQLELLDTLLQWSRLETNRVQVRPEVLNMDQLAETCFLSLSGIAQKKGINLVRNIPTDVSIIGDHLLLSQVIQNLISNALKFTKKGGEISLNFQEETPDGLNVFTVQDNGIGMPDSIRSKLFQIDTKVSRKGTAGEAGTGLGLLVCKEIVDLHGGSITVKSTEGVGTVFSFSLIKAFPNVLVIYDDENNAKFLNYIFKENFPDLKIFTVNSIDDAKKQLGANRFSLIVYENSNSTNGNDLFLEYVNEKIEYKHIPFVLVTSITSQEILENFLVKGVDFLISIPVDKEKTVDIFQKILFGLANQD